MTRAILHRGRARLSELGVGRRSGETDEEDHLVAKVVPDVLGTGLLPQGFQRLLGFRPNAESIVVRQLRAVYRVDFRLDQRRAVGTPSHDDADLAISPAGCRAGGAVLMRVLDDLGLQSLPPFPLRWGGVAAT